MAAFFTPADVIRRQVGTHCQDSLRKPRLREAGLSKNTVADIVKRGRINAMHTNAPVG
jgi:hypothetical protein